MSRFSSKSAKSPDSLKSLQSVANKELQRFLSGALTMVEPTRFASSPRLAITELQICDSEFLTNFSEDLVA